MIRTHGRPLLLNLLLLLDVLQDRPMIEHGTGRPRRDEQVGRGRRVHAVQDEVLPGPFRVQRSLQRGDHVHLTRADGVRTGGADPRGVLRFTAPRAIHVHVVDDRFARRERLVEDVPVHGREEGGARGVAEVKLVSFAILRDVVALVILEPPLRMRVPRRRGR